MTGVYGNESINEANGGEVNDEEGSEVVRKWHGRRRCEGNGGT